MPRPNIMLLVGEDTSCSHGCYGNSVARSPAIDRLAAEGARYTRAFSTAPVCAPSRTTLVSGKIAFSFGTHHMRSTLLHPPRLFTEELRDAGYYVNWSNKTDFNFTPPASFADDTSPWFDDLAEGRLPAGKPWFLYHNCFITHESTMWEESWREKVAPFLAPEERTDPAAVRVPAYLPDTDEVRMDIARYLDSLLLQDREVAQALHALDRSGQRDNTIVIYLADHGRGLAREKRWLYEAGIHLPLIIRWPGSIEPSTVEDELVSWLDVAPTILSLAGIPRPADYQGRVFLGPEKSAARNYCFAGRDRMDEVFDRVRAVRSERFLYLRNYHPELPWAARQSYMERQETTRALREHWANGTLTPAAALFMAPAKPAEELYDAEADPDCIHNLAADPSLSELLSTMRQALDDFLAQVGDLGAKSERELIDRGLVADRMEEYYARVEPLPERYRLGAERAPVEIPTAVSRERRHRKSAS